ncbi:MAG: efflux RND transporter periplasmic adaptor subunit [Candidatus Paceibacterota bacterium]
MKFFNKYKKIIIIFGVVLAVILIYQIFFKKNGPALTLYTVSRGTVIQEVSETGTIKKGEKINLSFKSAGKVEKVYVEVGEEVKEGDPLAKLDSRQLYIQLEEAKASLDLYRAQFNKLVAGASTQDVQIAKTAVDNAEASSAAAQQSLADVKLQAEDSLASVYENAFSTLDDAYLKIFNSYSAADSVQRAYFLANDQEGLKVRESVGVISTAMSGAKSYLDAAKVSSKRADTDVALSKMKDYLSGVSGALKIIRDNCETAGYRDRVTLAEKTSLDTHRGYINTALTNVATSQQTISSTKITNDYNINTAQASVSATAGALKLAQDQYTKVTSDPRQEDLDLYTAQVNQAEARVSLLESQIGDTTLRSPTSGQIASIEKREGEIVQGVMITLLPASPFEVRADIYEEDVVKMKVGNPVEISLVAFPDQIFTGKVVEIDPAGQLIDGVVYYETTIDFDNVPDGVKPEMTADINVRTAIKENVLFVSRSALQTKNGKDIVQVLKDEKTEDREVVIGLEGKDNTVEIVSGLQEGEKIVIK